MPSAIDRLAPSTRPRRTRRPPVRRRAGLAPGDRRVGDAGPQHERVGAGGDRGIDIVEPAGLAVEAALRQSEPDLDRIEPALVGIMVAQVQHRADRDRKQHVHRVLADDGDQRAGAGADHVAHGQRGAADLAGDRRVDLGVVQVDLRRACSCAWANWTCAARLACCASASSTVERWPAGVFSSAWARLSVMMALRSRACSWATVACLACRSASNGPRSRRYSRSPCWTSAPFGEQSLLDEGGDPGDDIDAIGRLHAADEFGGFRDRLLLHLDDADNGRPGRAELRGGRSNQQQQQPDSQRRYAPVAGHAWSRGMSWRHCGRCGQRHGEGIPQIRKCSASTATRACNVSMEGRSVNRPFSASWNTSAAAASPITAASNCRVRSWWLTLSVARDPQCLVEQLLSLGRAHQVRQRLSIQASMIRSSRSLGSSSSANIAEADAKLASMILSMAQLNSSRLLANWR